MKATAYIKLLLLLPIAACDRSTKLAYEDEPEKVHTIVYLKSLCTENSVAVTRDITVKAVVTANDLYEEFFKTLVIEDSSGGITISIDRTDLADDYPVGAAVSLSCNGLRLGEYGGKIQIGSTPEPGGEYSVGRISQENLARYLRRDTDRDAIPEPRSEER
uniref:DUF5689 domain-containing protein n=1 Tax=uncultured Alistipes sp. TaxID=538949 RepID=UPI0027D9BDB3